VRGCWRSTPSRLTGWAAVLERALRLEFDIAVPASGPLLTRSGVEALKQRVDTLAARAAAQVKAGTPKDRFLAALEMQDLGAPAELPATALDALYAELGRA
jgi:hypothetical protein